MIFIVTEVARPRLAFRILEHIDAAESGRIVVLEPDRADAFAVDHFRVPHSANSRLSMFV